MADLEVGSLQHTSSIAKNAAKNTGLCGGVLGMRLVSKSMNFDDPSIYHMAYAEGASSTGHEERPTQVELAAVRPLGRRGAETAALLVGSRTHV